MSFSHSSSDKFSFFKNSSEEELKKWKKHYPSSGPCSYFDVKPSLRRFFFWDDAGEFNITNVNFLDQFNDERYRVKSNTEFAYDIEKADDNLLKISIKLSYKEDNQIKFKIDDFTLYHNKQSDSEKIKIFFNLLDIFKSPVLKNYSYIGGKLVRGHCNSLENDINKFLKGDKFRVVDLGRNFDFIIGMEVGVPLGVIGEITEFVMERFADSDERNIINKFVKYNLPLGGNTYNARDRKESLSNSPCDWINDKLRKSNVSDKFLILPRCRLPYNVGTIKRYSFSSQNRQYNPYSNYSFDIGNYKISFVSIDTHLNQNLDVEITWTDLNQRFILGSSRSIITQSKYIDILGLFELFRSRRMSGFLSEYRSVKKIKSMHLFNPIEIFERIVNNNSFLMYKPCSIDYFIGTIELGITEETQMFNTLSTNLNDSCLSLLLLHFYYFTGSADFSEAFKFLPGSFQTKKKISRTGGIITKNSQIKRYMSDVSKIFLMSSRKPLYKIEIVKNSNALDKALEKISCTWLIHRQSENYIKEDEVILCSNKKVHKELEIINDKNTEEEINLNVDRDCLVNNNIEIMKENLRDSIDKDNKIIREVFRRSFRNDLKLIEPNLRDDLEKIGMIKNEDLAGIEPGKNYNNGMMDEHMLNISKVEFKILLGHFRTKDKGLKDENVKKIINDPTYFSEEVKKTQFTGLSLKENEPEIVEKCLKYNNVTNEVRKWVVVKNKNKNKEEGWNLLKDLNGNPAESENKNKKEGKDNVERNSLSIYKENFYYCLTKFFSGIKSKKPKNVKITREKEIDNKEKLGENMNNISKVLTIKECKVDLAKKELNKSKNKNSKREEKKKRKINNSNIKAENTELPSEIKEKIILAEEERIKDETFLMAKGFKAMGRNEIDEKNGELEIEKMVIKDKLDSLKSLWGNCSNRRSREGRSKVIEISNPALFINETLNAVKNNYIYSFNKNKGISVSGIKSSTYKKFISKILETEYGDETKEIVRDISKKAFSDLSKENLTIFAAFKDIK